MAPREKSAVVLRPVDWSRDEAFLRALYTSTREAELMQTDWPEEQKSAFCRQQFEAQRAHYELHYPGASFQVVEQAGELIGRLYVDRWSREIRIMDIVLLPQYCGKGLGTQLLRVLMDEAATVGKSLTIHVERFNPALRLYQRLGFELLEDKGVYLLMGWGLSDADPMGIR